MAPKLIKFPDTPKSCIILKAKNIAKGITDATKRPARQLPKNKISINNTIKAPSIKFFSTVLIALFTNCVLSKYGSI